MSTAPTRPIDTVTRFAAALDEEDYPAAHALLSPECTYRIRDETLRGPDAIVASYRGNGDCAATTFDEITYASRVDRGDDDWIVITFADFIRHAGHALDHKCEQHVRVDDAGRIVCIEHRDLPGERARLAAFRRDCGLEAR